MTSTLTTMPAVTGARAAAHEELASEHAADPQGAVAGAQGRDEDRDREIPRAAVAETPLSKEGVVARLFEAFTRRDLLSALSLVHPDVVFQPMTAEVTRAGEPYRGHEGIRRYSEDIAAHWETLSVHPAQIRAAGRAVVALGLVSGSGAAGSFENAPTTWVVKFEDGLVSHVQIFSDPRKVVGALGGGDAAE